MREGRLFFTTDLEGAVRRSEVVFICVGTPPKEDGGSDLSAVKEVAKGIARALERYTLIVNKSTVPVGTGDLVADLIERNKRRDVDFDVVSNPEFLREGSAIQDALHPDRIVIGVPHRHVALKLLELYAPLECPMLITDVRSAEMIKYASNAFLAMKISFANAIADLCELVGADVVQVMKGVGADSRIGRDFLHAGLGYGGSCFPKDVEALLHTAQQYGYELGLLREVAAINDDRPRHFVRRIRERLGSLQGRVIAVWGLAFKPNTDDMRNAVSLKVIRLLLEEGATVRAYDPVAMEKARPLLNEEVILCETAYDAASDADALAIVTEWNEFRQVNFERLRELLQRPLIFDGRNIYDPQLMQRLGFEYHSIGRPSPSPHVAPEEAEQRLALSATGGRMG
jgi:UDPglucose 6-dehydrogenase